MAPVVSGFDRIRDPRQDPGVSAGGRARRALFSEPEPQPSPALICTLCGVAFALSLTTLVRVALPVAVVLPWKRAPLFAKCPACRRRTWLTVRLTPFGPPR